MSWSKIEKAPLPKNEKRESPDALWVKCTSCQAIIYRKDFQSNQNVCPKCSFHFPISAPERIKHFLDAGSFVELDVSLQSLDPLKFEDKVSYGQRLEESERKLNEKDAFVSGTGRLFGRPVQIGVYDFRFMGGSMGCVVGEKITRVFLRAKEEGQAAIVFSTSGGARMQEGLLSLMQMAKTCAALGLMRDDGVPFISVLTHPTTGGVAASYALLGDINIAEPGSLIGFAGPRVIQQTIRANLPEGFQTAEFLLAHGMLDFICHRDMLRQRIGQLLDVLQP